MAEVVPDESELAGGRTFTTLNDLLVAGDGTPGAQQTTTTSTTEPDSSGRSTDEESRLIWMVIVGLGALALLAALLTWRYWLLTRPNLDLDDEDESPDGGLPGDGYPGAEGAAPGYRAGPDDWGEPTQAATMVGAPGEPAPVDTMGAYPAPGMADGYGASPTTVAAGDPGYDAWPTNAAPGHGGPQSPEWPGSPQHDPGAGWYGAEAQAAGPPDATGWMPDPHGAPDAAGWTPGAPDAPTGWGAAPGAGPGGPSGEAVPPQAPWGAPPADPGDGMAAAPSPPRGAPADRASTVRRDGRGRRRDRADVPAPGEPDVVRRPRRPPEGPPRGVERPPSAPPGQVHIPPPDAGPAPGGRRRRGAPPGQGQGPPPGGPPPAGSSAGPPPRRRRRDEAPPPEPHEDFWTRRSRRR